MHRLSEGKNGLSGIETIVTICTVLMVGFAGYLVYELDHNVTQVKTNVLSSSSLGASVGSSANAGWKTDSTTFHRLSFQYPSNWTISSTSVCTGGEYVQITANKTEVSQAINAAQYYVQIYKYGKQSSSCAPDGMDLKTVQFASVQSAYQLQSGIFKKDWLTFINGSNTNFFPTDPDTAILTAESYNGADSLTNDGTIQNSGSTYQISINTSATANEQYEEPATVNINTFNSTHLYKDTVGVLNSIR